MRPANEGQTPGEEWEVYEDSDNPPFARWVWVHKQYDGPGDKLSGDRGDRRCGTAATEQAAWDAIAEYDLENSL